MSFYREKILPCLVHMSMRQETLPRATTVAESETFQLKMVLLLAAEAFHFGIYRKVTRQNHHFPPLHLRLTGGLGLALRFGVALAGSAFILFE